MYQQGVYEGAAAHVLAATKPPGGPGMWPVEAVAKLEVWCTQFNDPGPDYTEFRAFDAAGRKLWTKRVNGF